MEYRVLARKYRPATFDDLIGQEVLVRTLSNAIKTGRLAHAFLLTGIRGIGKTTTARIIARALNCIGEDGQGGPTISPCGVCANCKMIAEDRHVDVIEMDAASRTGVGDIRELIETVHYAPTNARYKIYIIDEVHMLSSSAFNALLKTLEEPPPHVKFIFATTESRKIPVTILSRCQRFDLKRINEEQLGTHLTTIASKEEMTLSPEAAQLLAQAAEGSVRDGLSLLDQAIARHETPGEPIGESSVRAMLGLSEGGKSIALLTHLFKGEAVEGATLFNELYRAGGDPQLMLQDMLELVHFITRIKLVPKVANDLSYAEHERKAASVLAGELSMPDLARMWQLLLKGVGEVRVAPSSVSAAEMVIVRAAYMSTLPTPAEAIQKLSTAAQPQAGGNTASTGEVPSGAAAAPVASAPAEQEKKISAIPEDFPAMVALLESKREAVLAGQLRQFASLVSYSPGEVEIAMQVDISRDFPAKVAAALKDATGEEWKIMLSDEGTMPTLQRQAEQARTERINEAAKDPLVASVIEHFPGAKIEEVAS